MLFSSPAPVDDVPPTADTLSKAGSLLVQDEEGKEHSFSSLFSGHQQTCLIWIRHHHCGFCQEYVRTCAKNATFQNTKTKVIVIGHGSYEGIKRYKQVSECPFDMFVDSQKKLYTALGLTRRFMGKDPDSKEPAYFQGRSSFALVASSFQEAIGSGWLALKGGEISLLGGEFIIEGDSKCTFVHRMRDPMDHTDVDELAKHLDGPTPTSSALTPTPTPTTN